MEALETYLGVATRSPEEQVLRLLIELGAQFVGADEGSLLVLVEDEGELEFAMTVGSEASEAALIGQRVPLGKGITGLAAQTHEVQIGAPRFETRQASDRADVGDGQPTAVLAAPMLVQDDLIGVLTVVSFEPGRRFGSADALLYARIASVAGVVVQQRRQLTAMRLLSEGRDLSALTEEERQDQAIVEAVGALVAARPEAKATVVRVLTDLAALVKG